METTYTYVPVNSVGAGSSATVSIIGFVPPGIDHAPSVYQVIEGNELILFCNATGNPKPDITWTKKGKSCELPTSETLTLTKLTREDQSIYECEAKNYLGSTQVFTKITVLYLLQPSIQHCSTPVNEGDNVTLNCKGNGNPSPCTAWIKSGKVPSDRQ